MPTGAVLVLLALGIAGAFASRHQHDLSVLEEAAARPTLLGATDMGADTDADFAADTESDSDRDMDLGADPDAEPDSYADAAAESDPDPDAEPDSYAGTAAESDPAAEPDSYAGTAAEPDPGEEPGSEVGADSNSDTHTHTDDPGVVAERHPTPSVDPGSASSSQGRPRFTFTREDVLGTSFRLVVVAPSRERAAAAERVVLDEIERHRRTFSTYDPQSELSKINALPWEERREIRLSKYLARVLRWSLRWHEATDGAFDPYLGELAELWRRASAEGRTPTAAELAKHQGGRPGFRLERRKQRKKKIYYLTCHRPGRFDLSGIAKGFIIDKALAAIEKRVDGALLDIGGDIAVLGHPQAGRRAGWLIGVADPRKPAENDPPLDTVALTHMAIASSGGYARSVVAEGRPRSHILDPRTGRPADRVLGATVIAPDAAVADALATALCVLEPAEGVALVERQSVAACLLVDRSGRVYRSRDWSRFQPPPPRAQGAAWPSGYALSITFQQVDSWKTVNPQRGKRRKFKRHGTAVWVEDDRGRRVRLVSLWFDRGEMGHVRKLDTFWRDGWVLSGSGANYRPLRAVSRASRRPGQYTVVWDGRDDLGRPVPQGRYTVRVDVNREGGPPRGREQHTVASVKIQCGATPARGQATDQPELKGVRAEYGPR